MGTRGLAKVIKNDEAVVVQYGQWDHYPSGQGLTALNFLRNPDNVNALENNLSKLTYPNQDELDTMFGHEHPSLHRDTGAGILELIATADKEVPLFLDVDFENDDLFCEGVYTVNLDTKLFTTKYHGKEFTITFDMAKDITDDLYLTLSECNVYEYEKSQAIAS